MGLSEMTVEERIAASADALYAPRSALRVRPGVRGHPVARWSYDFVPDGDATLVTESWED